MSRSLPAGAAALLLLLTGTAMADSTTIVMPPAQNRVIVAQPPAPPAVVPPSPGTMSTERSQATLNPDGSQSVSHETTYRNGNGVANDSVSSTTTYPPVSPPVAVTTRQHTETTVTQ